MEAALLRLGQLRRVLAQVEVTFSNSMIEAWWRSLKHNWLFLNQLDSLAAIDRRGVPQWLELDKEKFTGRVKSLPAREDFTLPLREQLIVELYSK